MIMTDLAQVIYILHGEDEFAINRFLSELESDLIDPGTTVMNSTRLDGQSLDMDELLSVLFTLPFLAKRRLVTLVHPLACVTTQPSREKFLDLLEKLPPTSALALVEYKFLTDKKDLKNKNINWLEEWARNKQVEQYKQNQGIGKKVPITQDKLSKHEGVHLKAFPVLKGTSMVYWIQNQVKEYGGQFSYRAAGLLASLVSGDPRLADQEIQKLLAYVNYERPVEEKDVETLTADAGQGNIFALVDSIAIKDGKTAISSLHRLLEYEEHIQIFGMVVRQFRLLLLTREMLDMGQDIKKIMSELRLVEFVAEKLILQARRFNISFLEDVYHRLLLLDEAAKTSKMPLDLSLETFVAEFTTWMEPPQGSH